jgi:hypothetical protein
MKKNVTQDIVPAKKSIRDVELPSRYKDEPRKYTKGADREDVFTRPVSINNNAARSVPHDEPVRIEPPQKPPVPPSDFKYSYSEPKKSNKKYLYLGIFVVIILAIFAISALFKSATITVTPIVQSKSIDESLVAKKDVSYSGLKFQLVNITKDTESAIDPKDIVTGQKVERKASGTIVIYNNAGSAPQKLVATTRFQTPEGQIFRLVDAVTVPGTSIKDGKQVPGSVEAVVVADQAGPSYNVGLKDFTLPGLKTDAVKYKMIYGRSKTEMSGGFSGIDKAISKEALSKVEGDLEATLRVGLSKDITAQIPADFVLFPDSLTYKFDPVVTVTTGAGTTVAKKKGVASAIIFDRKSLTKEILSKVLPEGNSDLISITNLDALKFSLLVSTSSILTSPSINFSLKGDANFVWVIDADKLKSDLLGLSKSNANTVMSAYPSIKEAWVLTRPFWNGKIPTDPKKVNIINTFEK